MSMYAVIIIEFLGQKDTCISHDRNWLSSFTEFEPANHKQRNRLWRVRVGDGWEGEGGGTDKLLKGDVTYNIR